MDRIIDDEDAAAPRFPLAGRRLRREHAARDTRDTRAASDDHHRGGTVRSRAPFVASVVASTSANDDVDRESHGADASDADLVTDTAPVSNADRVVASLTFKLQRCYETGLNKDSKMKGNLTMTATVAPNGEVTATSSSSTSLSAELKSCAERHLRSTMVDAPGGGGSTLTFPITFATK